MKPKSFNRKVRNATQIQYDGITFKSKLEKYTYIKLKENGIEAEYEPSALTILPEFTYRNYKIRKMTYTPDFVSNKFIIECKGHPNESWPLRWKVFLRYLHSINSTLDVYVPRNTKEVDAVISNILNTPA